MSWLRNPWGKPRFLVARHGRSTSSGRSSRSRSRSCSPSTTAARARRGRASRRAGSRARAAASSTTRRCRARSSTRSSSASSACSSRRRSASRSRSACSAGAAAAAARSTRVMLLPLVTPEIVMGVALLLLFLQVLPRHRARLDGAGDRPGDVHALVRRRDRARPARLDRPGLRGGRRRPRRAAARPAAPRPAAAARARDHRQRRGRLRDLDRRLRRHPVPLGRREHDDGVDAALRLGPRARRRRR